jgi:hypothetical protein
MTSPIFTRLALAVHPRRLRAAAAEFFYRPASPGPFIFLRAALAAVLLVRALAECGILLELYGNRGLISWSISEIRPTGWVPNMSWVAGHLGAWGVSEDQSLYAVFVVYVAGLIGMFVGWRARLTTAVVWLTHLVIFESASFSSYGVDSFINIGLFYCVIMPRGAAVSLFGQSGGRSRCPTVTANLLLRVLQLHVCVVYFTSGLEKAKGSQWWDGEAIWRSVMQPQFQSFDMSWLAWMPFLALVASCGTLAIEIGYPFMIWPRRTRPFWLVAVLCLHLSIAIFLGLRLFAAVLIVLNLAAFGSSLVPVLKAASDRVRRALRWKSLLPATLPSPLDKPGG